MDEWIALVQQELMSYSPKMVGALVVLVVGHLVARMLTRLVRRLMETANVDATLAGFLSNLVKFALLTFVAITAVGQLGVQTTTFAAVIGAAGLAIGLSLQSSLGNFASGVMLILLRPFEVGDYIEVAGVSGEVRRISVFATNLSSPDNKSVVVPNGTITSGNIVNYSAHDTRRVDMLFGIGYEDDIRKAKQLFEKILEDDPRVLDEPAPKVALSELAESSVNFIVRPWVKTEDYWDVFFDVTERVKLDCDANGISIPFPQQDVHVRQIA